MITETKIVHLLSGGLDSTVLLYDLTQQGCQVHCLLFNYGQSHVSELQYARKHCELTKTPFTEIELYRTQFAFRKSMLTDGRGGNVVPNRNAVLLNIAVAIAIANDAEMVTYACNKDDREQFPDCRPEFLKALNETLKATLISVEVCAPYGGLTKRQIVQHARKNKWPYDDTMSCYGGNDCGMCDACRKRKAACA